MAKNGLSSVRHYRFLTVYVYDAIFYSECISWYGNTTFYIIRFFVNGLHNACLFLKELPYGICGPAENDNIVAFYLL